MDAFSFKSSGINFKYSEESLFQLSTPAFALKAGETIAILGPSGGGKSTLLRIIEGSLKEQNSSITTTQRAALVYQDLRLVNEKTALDNCLMGALGLKKIPQYERVQRAKDILKRMGLGEHLNQTVSMLSGGQKQRVAIARAIMSEPGILIADECFSHLDPATAGEVYKLIKEFQAELGFTWVVTVHHSFLPHSSFDQVWSVENGILSFAVSKNEFQYGDVNDLKKEPSQLFYSKIFFAAFLLLAALSFYQIDLIGFNFLSGFSELFVFLNKLLFHSIESLTLVKWSFLFQQLILTLQMALVGTVFGFILSLPLAFMSADEIAPRWLSRPTRLLMMIVRSVPALIWALFFVAAFGLGPISGISALATYSVGYFSKLLYEGIEDAERKPFLAIKQLGANTFQATLAALFPSLKPLFVSTFIFLLEYNVRSASLLGLVGAGGIGQDLIYSIEWRDYATVFSILLLLLTTVFVFDQISKVTRREIKKYRGV